MAGCGRHRGVRPSLIVLVSSITLLTAAGCVSSGPGTPSVRPAPSAATNASSTSKSAGHPRTVPRRAGPVILLPGYGGHVDQLMPLARDLRATGRIVRVLRLPGGGTGDLRVQAAALGRLVARLRARFHAASVDLVGYSAGGVVARLWVRDHAAKIVRRVVGLGAPQHGTVLAGLARTVAPRDCPTACRQLAPGSALLRGLNAGDETPDGPRWVEILSTSDGVVVPSSSAHLAGALNIVVQQVCPRDRPTHAELPEDPVVRQIVVGVLERRSATRPGPSACRAARGGTQLRR